MSQREVRGLMIEARVGPGARVVAGRAFGAEGAAMHVILLVTVQTAGRRATVRFARTVACSAGQGRVGPIEREIGEGVVETRGTELVDIGVATEMLGMTSAALPGACVLHPPVIARRAADIRGDLLVTVEAETGLARAIRAVVAGAAVGFELLVSPADRPRHDQLLEVGRPHAGRQQQHEERENQCPRH